jgi:pentapeptide MXKDX repeat protein
MKMIISSVAILVAVVLSVAASAQSGDKMDQMAKDQTYTGCVAAGTMAGTFTLTHITADHMGKDAMKKDSMAKDTMSKDAMAPTTLTVTSSSVDLSKHLGHKVSITGSPAARGKMDAMKKDAMAKDSMAKEASAFTVKSLKMVAASCS